MGDDPTSVENGLPPPAGLRAASPDRLDLDAYLRRISYDGPREPTPQVLYAIVAAHVLAIPYENIDVLLKRRVGMDVASVQRKLVRERRGGYCFELNTLLEAALDLLGFAVSCLGARVVHGVAPGADVPGNHKVLRIDLAGDAYVVDAGLGSLTPTSPIVLRADEVQQTAHEPLRLVAQDSGFMLEVRLGDIWDQLFHFSLAPKPHAVFEATNWFCSTAATSPFLTNLIVARPTANGRATLFNRRFTVRDGSGHVIRRSLDGIGDYREILVGYFGLPVDDDDLTAIMAAMARHRSDAAVDIGFEDVLALGLPPSQPAADPLRVAAPANEPHDPFGAAVTHHAAGRLAQAEALYRQVLAAQPRHLDALNNLGALALQAGRNETAIYLLNKALAQDDEIAGCHANLGEACRRLNLHDEAADHYLRALALGCEFPWVSNNLAYVRQHQGRHKEAVESFRQAIARDTDYAEAHSGLGFALLSLGRFGEAVAAHDKGLALAPDWDTRLNYLAAHGRFGEAAGVLEQAFWETHGHAAMRPAAARPLHLAGEPIRRLVLHDGMHLVKNTEVDEIAEACGLPVRVLDLYEAAPADYASPDTLVILASVVDKREPGIACAIKEAEPDCRVVAWHFDNHSHYLRNARLAAVADLSVPAHATAVDYLSRWAAGGRLGPIVPLATMQWPARILARLWETSRGEPRADALSGDFAFYPAAYRRNRFLAEILAQWPDAEVSLKADWDYHKQSPAERFQRWRRYKASIVLPLCQDIPIRFFDALATGQVPIVPRDIIDFDRLIPPADQAMLPVVRLEDYSLAALRAAHLEAIDAFDRGGEAGADRRHRYVMARHMLAHRYRAIVAYAQLERTADPAGPEQRDRAASAGHRRAEIEILS